MKTTYLKIYNILTLSERRGALVLFALMIAGMILETLGIGLIIPAITLMMQDDFVSKYPAVASMVNFMGNPSQKKLIAAAMLGLVGIYLFKNLFLAFLVVLLIFFFSTKGH